MAKKSNKIWWFILGGVGLGAVWLRQQATLIQFGNISIPFQQLKNGQINLRMVLPIVNASSLAARVTGFTGYIVSPTGNLISTVFQTAPATVPRYSQAELNFTTSIRLTDLPSEVAAVILSGGAWSIKQYRLKGQVRVYGIPIPIDVPLL